MDNVSATLDASAVLSALKRLGDTALKYTKPASKISADSIQREARRRVRRATGQTADNILVLESYDKQGYVVLTKDQRTDGTYKQAKHVGLWLEGGTKHMPAHPFFYPSAKLEVAAHERRIGEAVGRAIAESGLG